ncbi:MAG: spore cortex biosynthesis protein YabQ [Clostridia bacterium]|nr:spore cortex biosynthesis protein YabQ [Clostridia bacterium]
MGAIFCLFYDVLRAIRKCFKNSAMIIFFEDVIFSLIVAFSTFLFLLSVTNGEVRGFILLGMGIGVVLSRVTVSVIWLKLLRLILNSGKAAFLWVSRGFYSGFDFLVGNTEKILQKCGKTLKKVLKKLGGLLYTNRDRKV